MSSRRRTPGRSAFTLIELLVVIGILVLLAALILPAIMKVSDSTARVQTEATIRHLLSGLRAYAAADPYRLYPPSASDDLLLYDPSDPLAVLTIMGPDPEDSTIRKPGGYELPMEALSEREGTRQYLLDGWGRPLRYQLDGPFRNSSGVQDGGMNGVADRPADLADWNPAAEEPYPYVWSIGEPIDDDADAEVANADHWMYERKIP